MFAQANLRVWERSDGKRRRCFHEEPLAGAGPASFNAGRRESKCFIPLRRGGRREKRAPPSQRDALSAVGRWRTPASAGGAAALPAAPRAICEPPGWNVSGGNLTLCSALKAIRQRRVEAIFHQETKGAAPPNHSVPLCISNDGLRRQIDEGGGVEAVYRLLTGCLPAFQSRQAPVSRREAVRFGGAALGSVFS